MGRASLTWLAAPVASSAEISILVDCWTSLGFERGMVTWEENKSCLKMFSSPGGGRGGKEEGGSMDKWGGRNTLGPLGELGGKRGGDVGEEEAGDDVGGELGVVGSLLLVGVFELSRESMQKLEGSFSNLVLNSL